MEKLMQKLVLMLFVGAIAMGSSARLAYAVPQFHKEFVKLYVKDTDGSKESESSEKEPSFAELVTGAKTKCFTCHQGKKKKNNNRYGQELAKLLDKKKDKKDKEKIIEALEKVAKMHTDAKDKKSPTYGDLIKAGKFPGGSLEEVMKEPKKAGSDSKAGSDTKGSAKK